MIDLHPANLSVSQYPSNLNGYLVGGGAGVDRYQIMGMKCVHLSESSHWNSSKSMEFQIPKQCPPMDL